MLTIVPEAEAADSEAHAEPYGPPAPVPEPSAMAQPGALAAPTGSDTPIGGTFLRLFSGLRES